MAPVATGCILTPFLRGFPMTEIRLQLSIIRNKLGKGLYNSVEGWVKPGTMDGGWYSFIGTKWMLPLRVLFSPD